MINFLDWYSERLIYNIGAPGAITALVRERVMTLSLLLLIGLAVYDLRPCRPLHKRAGQDHLLCLFSWRRAAEAP
ncbi:hypothetical protein [Ectopseudomonas mendocina]|uniref:hypothetical protein n=1 Tax=Ectopseudomonas mendocina TaxID=300 RepID=UPI00131A4F2A|nr:hypothetical protein [Pseudomonas mendocina]